MPSSRAAAAQIAADLGLREHHAAAEIVRVLDRDEPGRRQHDVAARLAGGAELGGGEQAAAPIGGELHPGIGRAGAGLVPDAYAPPRRRSPRRPVGSAPSARPGSPSCRSARTARLPCRAARRCAPAGVDRRVLAILVVADRRIGHGPPHAREGRVTVSERRSIGSAMSASSSIGADRLADRGKPVAAQQFGKPALDPPEQRRARENQRGVELHQRGAGADLRIGIVGARPRRRPRSAASSLGSADTCRASSFGRRRE